jgi:hypothetical protein
MAKGSRDREPVGEDLEVIALLADEGTTPRRPEREDDDKDWAPRRRGLFLLAIAGVVVALAGVSVVGSLDGGDSEAEPRRGTSNPSRMPAVVPGSTVIPPDTVGGSTTIPPEERPPETTPGDASTTAPLLPEGAPSSPHLGELVAFVTNFDDGAYYLYADGRLIWTSAAGGEVFVEQRLTPQGVERVRSQFLAAGSFDANPPPAPVATCGSQACVRDEDGRFLTGRVSPTDAARLVSYFETLDTTLPETEWAAPRIRTYVPSRNEVCLQTFVNIPNRVVPVPPNLSILLSAFPARAAELLGSREPEIPPRNRSGSPCFEVTLDEARILADEFLSPTGGGSHQYSGIVIRNPQFDAIKPDAHEGIVAYINFQALLPHGAPMAFYGG